MNISHKIVARLEYSRVRLRYRGNVILEFHKDDLPDTGIFNLVFLYQEYVDDPCFSGKKKLDQEVLARIDETNLIMNSLKSTRLGRYTSKKPNYSDIGKELAYKD